MTGASRGLGRSMAVTLARAGADLAVTSRNKKSLLSCCEGIKRIGRKVLPLKVDVNIQADIKSMIEETISVYGRVDILVNNSGCNIRRPALKLTWEEWNVVLDTNLKSAFFCSQAVAPYMIRAGKGKIINIVNGVK